MTASSPEGARDPRRDPQPGDVIEHRVGRFWNSHRVHEVAGGEVRYWDEGLLDHVPLKRWREWYDDKPGLRVTAAKAGPATKSAGAQSRASEARARARGGRRLPGGTLQPDAAEALAKLQAAGYADSATACIARALVEAAKRAQPKRKTQ